MGTGLGKGRIWAGRRGNSTKNTRQTLRGIVMEEGRGGAGGGARPAPWAHADAAG